MVIGLCGLQTVLEQANQQLESTRIEARTCARSGTKVTHVSGGINRYPCVRLDPTGQRANQRLIQPV